MLDDSGCRGLYQEVTDLDAIVPALWQGWAEEVSDEPTSTIP